MDKQIIDQENVFFFLCHYLWTFSQWDSKFHFLLFQIENRILRPVCCG